MGSDADYDKWPEFAKPMVNGIKVVSAGDETGNGLVRCVSYKLPLGFRGESIETINDVEPGIGYTYTSRKGTIGKNKTRLHFQERLKLNPPFSWFEGNLQRFIEKYNRKTMMNVSTWLHEHSAYRDDLIE